MPMEAVGHVGGNSSQKRTYCKEPRWLSARLGFSGGGRLWRGGMGWASRWRQWHRGRLGPRRGRRVCQGLGPRPRGRVCQWWRRGAWWRCTRWRSGEEGLTKCVRGRWTVGGRLSGRVDGRARSCVDVERGEVLEEVWEGLVRGFRRGPRGRSGWRSGASCELERIVGWEGILLKHCGSQERDVGEAGRRSAFGRWGFREG